MNNSLHESLTRSNNNFYQGSIRAFHFAAINAFESFQPRISSIQTKTMLIEISNTPSETAFHDLCSGRVELSHGTNANDIQPNGKKQDVENSRWRWRLGCIYETFIHPKWLIISKQIKTQYIRITQINTQTNEAQ